MFIWFVRLVSLIGLWFAMLFALSFLFVCGFIVAFSCVACFAFWPLLTFSLVSWLAGCFGLVGLLFFFGLFGFVDSLEVILLRGVSSLRATRSHN